MKRYTCRLYHVELPDGRTLVTYTDPPTGPADPVDYIGKEPVQEPAAAFTPEEMEQWEIHMGVKYTMTYGMRACGLPPVEVEEVPDIADAVLTTVIHPIRRPERPATVVVEVKNVGNTSVGKLSGRLAFQNETPQEEQIQGFDLQEMSMSIQLIAEDGFSGTLSPGDSVRFLLEEGWIESVTSRTVALSPERYWVEILSMDQEVTRIEGAEFGAVIETLE